MDCPNCKVYNPEERTVCWRCNQPLPKPVVKKKRRLTSQQWLYVIVAVMIILMLANMCGLPGLLPTPPESTGSLYLGPWPLL
jgi:uncharacterized paraquat-inducible protein A